MKLSFRTRHIVLTPELRDQMQRRLDFALGRLIAAVRAIDVTIVDVNGPKGGADKQCRIRVRGLSRDIVIEQTGIDTLSTFSVAAERAGRAVARSLARGRIFVPALAT
jgi:hypothetical protein